MHFLKLLYSHFVHLILFPLPDAPLTMRFRGWLYSFGMRKCGKDFQVSSTAILRGLEKISCGDNVYIGPNSYVLAREEVVIESEVLVAMNVVIVDANHGRDIDTNSYRFKRGRAEKVLIGRGSWIAANSVITAGTVLKSGSLVTPCSVVRRGDSL